VLDGWEIPSLSPGVFVGGIGCRSNCSTRIWKNHEAWEVLDFDLMEAPGFPFMYSFLPCSLDGSFHDRDNGNYG